MPLPRPGRFQKKAETPEESSSDEESAKNTPDVTKDEKVLNKKFAFVTKEDDEEEEDDEADEPIGVIRASQQDKNTATLELEEGTIKNLAHMFQSITQGSDTGVSRQPFKMDIDENDGEIVLESTPTEQNEGVIRASDPSEWQKPIDVERGATKNLASRFLNKTREEPPVKKKPFKMDIDEAADAIVLESEPVVLEGVVRSSDKQEEVTSKKGRIKNLAKGFVTLAQEEAQDLPKGDREETRASRTVSQRWKGNQANQDEKVRERIQLDAAPEFGVYENEPEVRDDVVRAGEDQPDVIHVKHTRNLKKMWCQFEKSEIEKEQNSKKPELMVMKKKKEESPPPPPKEPTPPPVEEPKKKSWAARRKQEASDQALQKTALKSNARKRF